MKVLLGVTGSVAAKLTSKMVKSFLDAGHEVAVVTTTPGQFFFDPEKVTAQIWRDKDEWPEDGYHKGDPVQHIDFAKWADILVIAPLSANTLAKMALGLCDNFLCCIIRAWPREKPVVIAPAMNTVMWTHPVTEDHLNILENWYDLIVVGPVSGVLACKDVGVGAMAGIGDIVKVVDGIAEEMAEVGGD